MKYQMNILMKEIQHVLTYTKGIQGLSTHL